MALLPLQINKNNVSKKEKIWTTETEFNAGLNKIIAEDKLSGFNTSHFTFNSFKCKCGCGEGRASSLIVRLLLHLQSSYPQELIWGSAYRCEAYNAAIGGVPGSQHTKGKAVDFGFKDSSLNTSDNMRDLASKVQWLTNGHLMDQDVSKDKDNWWGGLGWYDTWVHMDTRDYKYYYHTGAELHVDRFDMPVIIFNPRLEEPNVIESANTTNPTYIKYRVKEYLMDNKTDGENSIRSNGVINNLVNNYQITNESNFSMTPTLGAVAYWSSTEIASTSYQAIVEKISADKKELILSSYNLLGDFKLFPITLKDGADTKVEDVILPEDVTSLSFTFKGFVDPPIQIQGSDGEGEERLMSDKVESIEEYIWYYLIGAFEYFNASNPEVIAAGIMAHIQEESNYNNSYKGPIYDMKGKASEVTFDVSAKNYINFLDEYNFNYDRIGYGLIQNVEYKQKKLLRSYTQDQVNHLRLQLELLILDLKENYSSQWKALISANNTSEAVKAIYDYVSMGKYTSNHILNSRQNKALNIKNVLQPTLIPTDSYYFGENIEQIETHESKENQENLEIKFNIPIYTALKDSVCETCGNFYTECNCNKNYNKLFYNPYIIKKIEEEYIQTIPNYLQAYSSKNVLQPKGIMIHHSPKPLTYNLKAKKGEFWNDMTNILISEVSPTTIKFPFHYCIGKNLVGDIMVLNTQSLNISLPCGGTGHNGSLDSQYIHILICGDPKDSYLDLALLISTLENTFNIKNSINIYSNMEFPTIISIDEALSMGYASEQNYLIENSFSWNKIITEIRNLSQNFSNKDHTDLYYVYDYNPIFSAPMLIGQWYNKDRAEAEAQKLAYGYIYYYKTDQNGNTQFTLLGDKTPPSEWQNRVFVSNPYDFWADNSMVKMNTSLYPLMPVSPNSFDGYWVVKNTEEKLGLIKLALR